MNWSLMLQADFQDLIFHILTFLILIYFSLNLLLLQIVGEGWLPGLFRVIQGMWMENPVMLVLIIPKA